MRTHRKTWIWFGRWWAIQLHLAPCLSFGVHLDLRRSYVDLYVACFSFTVGDNPVLTDAAEWKLNRCRGFITQDRPVL